MTNGDKEVRGACPLSTAASCAKNNEHEKGASRKQSRS